MKIVNPLGRDTSSLTDVNYNVTACMCNTWARFSSVQGAPDSCSHCGCACNSTNVNSNFNVAYYADTISL